METDLLWKHVHSSMDGIGARANKHTQMEPHMQVCTHRCCTNWCTVFVALSYPPCTALFIVSLFVYLSWPVFALVFVSKAVLFSLLALSVPCLGPAVLNDIFISVRQDLHFNPPPFSLPSYQFLPTYWESALEASRLPSQLGGQRKCCSNDSGVSPKIGGVVWLFCREEERMV